MESGDLFNLVNIPVLGDGSCYFHAIASAFYIPYQKGTTEEKKEIIVRFRKELSLKLKSENVYDNLSDGKLKEYAKDVPDYSLENMCLMLESDEAVDYCYQELISNEIDKDIYIIDSKTNDVVNICNHKLFYKGRKSIILLYQPGHYSLVGSKICEERIQTLFPPNHPLIKILYNKILEKSENMN